MAEITREEVNAKLEAAESRGDAHLATINNKLDTLILTFNNYSHQSNLRFAQLEESVRATTTAMASLKNTVVNTVLVTGISSVIAIVLGVAGFNAVLLSNMIASFESGKQTATSQAEVKRQVEATAELIKKMQAAQK